VTAVAYIFGGLCAVWLLAAALIAVRAVRTRVPAACRDDAWAPEACALTYEPPTEPAVPPDLIAEYRRECAALGCTDCAGTSEDFLSWEREFTP
jgi:hypothetical protein